MLMQRPMLSTKQPYSTENQLIEEPESLPNVFLLEHGLYYPRWFILSAMLDILLAIVLRIIAYFVPCSSNLPWLLSFYCEVDAGSFTLQSLSIYGLFLAGWLCFFLSGYQFIEYSSKKGRVWGFLSAISDVEKLHGFLSILTLPILVGIIAMWLSARIVAFPFTLACIVLGCAIGTLCYHPIYLYWKGKKQVIYLRGKPIPTLLYLFCCLPIIRQFKVWQRTQYNPGLTIAIYQKPQKTPPTGGTST